MTVMIFFQIVMTVMTDMAVFLFSNQLTSCSFLSFPFAMAIALSWVRLLDQSTEMNELALVLFRGCLDENYGLIDTKVRTDRSL